jgi:thiol-disulfide isomerase/thioredoxin
MTMASAGLGLSANAEAKEHGGREFAALGSAEEWLNSPRLTQASLAGKVVLVDFCTYTCINWLRTLPYRRAWAQRYREQFVLIGVHTPEFAFERNTDNVRRALREMRVEYPVAIDNDYKIWRAFKNRYWPALYFIDARGRLRRHHFGEGAYDDSELAIQGLLSEAGVSSRGGGVVAPEANGAEVAADWDNLKSPETYVGYDRMQNFASRGTAELDRRRSYTAPARLGLNQWGLVGDWTVGRQGAALSSPNGRIAYRFHARDLHLVMGPARRESTVRFRVSVDGRPPGAARGGDVDETGAGIVAEPRMYQLIRQPKPIVDRQFEIDFLDAGVETFAFTFG